MTNRGPIEVRAVGADARQAADAIGLLFRHLSPADRTGVLQQTSAAEGDPQEKLAGLFVALRGKQLAGAVWAQVLPGATAVLWPPVLSDHETEAVADLLLDTANRFLDRAGVVMAQSLLENHADAQAVWLLRSGFAHLADLLYMCSTRSTFPGNQPDVGGVQFEPYCEANHGRMAAVVQASFRETLDCPGLDGVRQIDDVLAGYRATGTFNPARWLLVRRQNRDVGCLLLTDHPDLGQWELVYMGLVPEARGQGWGVQIVRHAQWLAGAQGAPRLLLAVDAANRPAVAMYSEAGFAAWDRRSVFMRTSVDVQCDDAD